MRPRKEKQLLEIDPVKSEANIDTVKSISVMMTAVWELRQSDFPPCHGGLERTARSVAASPLVSSRLRRGVQSAVHCSQLYVGPHTAMLGRQMFIASYCCISMVMLLSLYCYPGKVVISSQPHHTSWVCGSGLTERPPLAWRTNRKLPATLMQHLIHSECTVHSSVSFPI